MSKRRLHPDLMCTLRRLDLDPIGHEAVIHVAPWHCTDMSGAVRFVKRQDPDIRHITVISGKVLDCWYIRDAGGWQCRVPIRRNLRVRTAPVAQWHTLPFDARYTVRL
jgi:hypothetical protein